MEDNEILSQQKVLGTSRVTRRFQITLVKQVRDLLEIQEGDLIIFIRHKDSVLIKKAK